MKVVAVIDNDVQNCNDGIAVSVWISGCSRHCEGCHNSDLWDFEFGKEIDDAEEFADSLYHKCLANGIVRHLSILGGEPLEQQNLSCLERVLYWFKIKSPESKIYLWTGFEFDEIKDLKILEFVDVLIDGPYKKEKKDLSLVLCGSTNQNIYEKVNGRFVKCSRKEV